MPVGLQKTESDEERRFDRCRGWFDWICRIWLVLSGGRKGGDPCVYLPEDVINNPDPCIYSQFMLMNLDQAVTWDNPDVSIFRDGVEQDTYDLEADTEYEVVVTVHNSSRDKPAIGTQVEVRWIEFGAGSQIRHPIASTKVDVPVWPDTNTVETTWRTPASPGHYCLEVELTHPEDGNPGNNRGWNNTQVKAADSEVTTPVRIFNKWPEGCPEVTEGGDEVSWERVLMGFGLLGVVAAPVIGLIALGTVTVPAQLLLLAVGYVGGGLLGLAFESVRVRVNRRRATRRKDHDRLPCSIVELTVDSYTFEDEKGKEADPGEMFDEEPPAWPARVEPSTFTFNQGEAYRDVELTVDAPDEPGPPEVFNVNVRQGGVPTGGVSVTVEREEA